ncbi:hypothetical protein E2C01_039207 [Portunus trituberculatus]|uniref:Uncharacterized protein n=1 Tax=Portunus trituberculatus TaxID=210409 RepID=A0A5B7FK58_PORTR|nr:hypothetical protein [Portunus trituberculatus]
MGRGEVILMRCRSGEVLGKVDLTVVLEALCSLVEALTSTDFQKAGSLSRIGPRESNYGTVAGLYETVTWRVHETMMWKVHETVTWNGRWRGGERGSKRRR